MKRIGVILLVVTAFGCSASVNGPNRAPVAVAGPDRVTEVDQPVFLDGGDSWDPDGDTITYQWDLIAAPNGAQSTISNEKSKTIRLSPDVKGVWLVRLVVNDGEHNSEADIVQVHVKPVCIPEQEGPFGDDTCLDEIDNDCDGDTDLTDTDCWCTSDQDCQAGEYCRNDGVCADDPCNPDPCINGTCEIVDDAANCQCAEGYAGDLCDECALNFQDNNSDGICEEACTHPDLGLDCGDYGSCSDASGTAVCICDTGYTGANCSDCAPGYHDEGGDCVEDTTCQPNSCNNHGTCDDTSGSPVCTCDTGYAGATCDQCDIGYQDNDNNDTCEPNCATSGLDCGDHGSCSDASGTAFCICDTGYTGATCDTCDTGYQDNDNNDICEPDCATASLDCNQVVSGGDCDDSGGTAQCVCNPGYIGADCKTCDVGYHDEGGVCVADVPLEVEVITDQANFFPLHNGWNNVIHFRVIALEDVDMTEFELAFDFRDSGGGAASVSVNDAYFFRGLAEWLNDPGNPQCSVDFGDTYLTPTFLSQEILLAGNSQDYLLQINVSGVIDGDNLTTSPIRVSLQDGTDVPISGVSYTLPES